ncbi:hypothetical protein LCGC14_0797850 [marine sediment metagenome]|uniref:Uncharacterized protein n=1 Tax=marine sediment metagenome TaxID=412755 RepID=A0A0F9PV02_9ZZZZ
MASGRQAMILGKKMVINLNNKGGVRRSPGTNNRSRCMRKEMKVNKKDFYEASTACKGKTGGGKKQGK